MPTQIAAPTTLTAAGVIGATSIASAGPSLISITVHQLEGTDPSAQIIVEDTVNGFTSANTLVTWNLAGSINATPTGQLTEATDVTSSWLARDLQAMRVGQANAQVRVRLASISSGGSISASAFLDVDLA